jgi:tight adherence protein B
MRPEVTAMVIASLPGLFAAAAADLVERERVRARAGVRRREPGSATARRLIRAWTLRSVCALAGVVVGSSMAGLPGAAMGAIGAIVVPIVRARRKLDRHAERMQEQLAEAVSVIAAGLRTGLSLLQAISLAAEDVGGPLGATLRELADRVSLGVPLQRSVAGWVAEVRVPEARLVGGVLGLHRRTGGDLPLVLDRLARTLRDRRAAAREVRSLTAQARLSGAILGFLPIGFFLFLSVTARRDIAAAYHSPTGATAIVAGMLMQGTAFLWIRRLLRVEG